MKRLAAILLLAACHHEVKASAQIVAVEQAKTVKADESTQAETKKQDATDVDTKTTKSDNAVIVQEPDGSSTVTVVAKDRPLVLKKGARVVGTVPIAQVVVDQSKHIGAVEVEKTGAKKSTETADTGKVVSANLANEEKSGVGFSLKFYLLAGGVLIAVSALGLFLARSKLIRRLLGVPL